MDMVSGASLITTVRGRSYPDLQLTGEETEEWGGQASGVKPHLREGDGLGIFPAPELKF